MAFSAEPLSNAWRTLFFVCSISRAGFDHNVEARKVVPLSPQTPPHLWNSALERWLKSGRRVDQQDVCVHTHTHALTHTHICVMGFRPCRVSILTHPVLGWGRREWRQDSMASGPSLGGSVGGFCNMFFALRGKNLPLYGSITYHTNKSEQTLSPH